jgi:hypothetical protein
MKMKFVILSLFSAMALSGQTIIYNFQALALQDSVRLTFTVLQGSVCSGYEVWKGSDSLNLQQIYSYPGLCGSITSPVSYSYTDFSPNKLTPNFYQIRIPPGYYSEVKRVDIAASFSDLLIYPQPVEDLLNIKINNRKNYYYEMNICDRYGRKKAFASGNVIERISINVSGLAEGVYPFYIILGDGSAFRGKFLKTPSK